MHNRIVKFFRNYFYWKIILIVIIGIVLFPTLQKAFKTVRNVFVYERIEKSILTLFSSDTLNFLVTNKLTAQIVVEISDNSAILGKREGILIGTVTMYYGVDLKEICASSVTKHNGFIYVKIPTPKELDFSIDPSSLKYITKRSGLNVITDYLMNKDIEAELRGRMKKSAELFFALHNMFPTHESIINQLNNYFIPFTAQFGVQIKFE